MSHRITRITGLTAPLLRLLRRRRRPGAAVHRPSVHPAGPRPPRPGTARPAAVPGIGLGSLGMPAVEREAGR
ncbi:hypothetical protein AB0K92_10010 [Streptomyces sp. NPDC052687]|uniref:hypothetical protein n=1 Tax=Streptomyces sp. NPDC052687 TaxID=3154759 RepID=UPI0034361AF4